MEEVKTFNLTEEIKEQILKSLYWNDLMTDAKLSIIEAIVDKTIEIRQASTTIRENFKILFFQDYIKLKKELINDKYSYNDEGTFNIWYSVNLDNPNDKLNEHIEFYVTQLVYTKLYLRGLDISESDTFYEEGIERINEQINDFVEDLYNIQANMFINELKEFEIEETDK